MIANALTAWSASKTHEARRGELRRRLNNGDKLRIIEAHSGLSAQVATAASISAQEGESRQFDGLWVSSLTSSASRGLPDMAMYAIERRMELVSEILAASSLPLIVDADNGGDATNFEYLCRYLEAAGASAVVIEDKRFPKRNSLSLNVEHDLEDVDIFSQKITRGRCGLLTDDFLIIARLESLIAGGSVGDAVSRAKAYLTAGADGILIHSKAGTATEVIEVLKAIREWLPQKDNHIPLVVVPTTYNRIKTTDLFDLGADIVIHANHLLRAAHAAIAEACGSILSHDRSFEATAASTSVEELFRISGYAAALTRDEIIGKYKEAE